MRCVRVGQCFMERFLGQGRFEVGPRAVRGVKGQTSSEGLPGNKGVWGVGMFWKSAGTPPVTSGLGKARSTRQEQ